jgi:hypothetical protein
VPLPLPDVTNQPQRMMAQVFELFTVHRQLARVKQVHAELNERNEEVPSMPRYEQIVPEVSTASESLLKVREMHCAVVQ